MKHPVLGPPMILEHFFDRCGTLPGLKGPSLTFMDPQMDPKTDIKVDPQQVYIVFSFGYLQLRLSCECVHLRCW